MDTESLLRSLNVHRVRYVIIGASAFPAHGYGRATLDLDVFIEPTKANARRTIAALADVGFDVSDLTIAEILSKKILFRQYVLDLDVHPQVLGVTFGTVWKHKTRKRIGTTLANFAGLDGPISMKRAANRPQDREDLKVLLALRRKK